MVDAANCGLEIAELCCCVLWCFALSQAGEHSPYVAKTISDEELTRIDRGQDVFAVLREDFSLPEVMRKG